MNLIIRYSLLSIIAGALAFGGCSSKEIETGEYLSADKLVEPITLKVVTFNVWDYYPFPNHKKRMYEIGRFLAQLDPDLVGLQEAFIKKDRRILLDQLKNSRLKHWKYYPSGVMGSGLMIISVFPIQETFFQRYSRNGKWYKPWQGDWYAAKGVAYARVKLPEDAGFLDFYTTHAVARYRKDNDLYVDDRLRQMKELALFVEALSSDVVPAILVGDMNCKRKDVEYQTVVEQAKLIRLMNIDSRIDHIFGVENPNYRFSVSDTKEVSHFESETGEKIRLSDHKCYMSTIRIQPGNDGSI